MKKKIFAFIFAAAKNYSGRAQGVYRAAPNFAAAFATCYGLTVATVPFGLFDLLRSVRLVVCACHGARARSARVTMAASAAIVSFAAACI